MTNSRVTSRGRYNRCQGPVPGRGPAVEKHCSIRLRGVYKSSTTFLTFRTERFVCHIILRLRFVLYISIVITFLELLL